MNILFIRRRVKGVDSSMGMSKEKFKTKYLSDQERYLKHDREFTSDQIADIIISYKKGESLRSLSRRYECSRDTITRRLKLWGIL